MANLKDHFLKVNNIMPEVIQSKDSKIAHNEATPIILTTKFPGTIERANQINPIIPKTAVAMLVILNNFILMTILLWHDLLYQTKKPLQIIHSLGLKSWGPFPIT